MNFNKPTIFEMLEFLISISEGITRPQVPLGTCKSFYSTSPRNSTTIWHEHKFIKGDCRLLENEVQLART
jgi:hypothetical protein